MSIERLIDTQLNVIFRKVHLNRGFFLFIIIYLFNELMIFIIQNFD